MSEGQNDCHPPGCTSILKLMLWHLDEESVDWKINTSIWFHYMKKKKSLMEDKRNNEAQRPHTRRNPKRHISLVSLLWHKIVAVRCFVWNKCGQAVRQ